MNALLVLGSFVLILGFQNCSPSFKNAPPPIENTESTLPSSSSPTEIENQQGPIATQAPIRPENKALLDRILKFAQTWKRNWNFDGHVMDSRFTASYGFWDYTETTYEPWLFDRVSVGYKLYQMSGDRQWLEQANSDFNWYTQRIDNNGIFKPKGVGDTKYSYIKPFVLKGKDNLTAQQLDIANKIYSAWLTDFPSNLKPDDGGSRLWTEREIGLALEAAVSYYELTQQSTALNRAIALVDQWQAFADKHNGAPLVTYTRHEGGGPGGTQPQDLVTSPWMSALYFQAARRLAEVHPAISNKIFLQASKYFDWLDNNNGFYSGSLISPQYSHLYFPAYLAGSTIGDGAYTVDNMTHAIDVAGMVAFAIVSKKNLGLSITSAESRLNQMRATAHLEFDNQTRSTTYLPKYRINPPRKFNWQLRGLSELIYLNP